MSVARKILYEIIGKVRSDVATYPSQDEFFIFMGV